MLNFDLKDPRDQAIIASFVTMPFIPLGIFWFLGAWLVVLLSLAIIK